MESGREVGVVGMGEGMTRGRGRVVVEDKSPLLSPPYHHCQSVTCFCDANGEMWEMDRGTNWWLTFFEIVFCDDFAVLLYSSGPVKRYDLLTSRIDRDRECSHYQRQSCSLNSLSIHHHHSHHHSSPLWHWLDYPHVPTSTQNQP